MNFLNRVKSNASMMIAFAATGAGFIGIGITGLASSPSYHHIISGLDHSWSSEKAAHDWITNNIEVTNEDVYEVSFGHYIPVDEIDEFISSKYLSEFDAETYYTSASYTTDADGKLTTTVSFSKDLITVYADSTGAGEFDLNTAIASWLETDVKYGHEFATSYSSQFATATESELNWLDQKESRNDFVSRTEYLGDSVWHTTEDAAKDASVEAHTYSNRDEFKYMSQDWGTDDAAQRSAAISLEELEITHIAAIPATVNTEADYQLTVDYTTDRDAWIVANTTPEDATDPDNIIPEVVPTETEYLAHVDYTANYDAWLLSNPDKNDGVDEYWTYNSSDYTTLATAETAVVDTVEATKLSRTRYSHNASNYDYDNLVAAKAGYKATLNPSTRTRWSHNKSDYDYGTEAEAITAYRSSLDAVAATSKYDWFGSTGLSVDWTLTQSIAEDRIQSSMSSKDAIVGELVPVYADYSLSTIIFYEDDTNLAYDSYDSMIAAYKATAWSHLETTRHELSHFNLKGTNLEFNTEAAVIEFWIQFVQEVKK